MKPPQLTATNGPLAPPAALVDRARDQLLARPGLTPEQHRDVGHGHLFDGARRLLHGGAAAHDAPERVVAVAAPEAVVQLAVLAHEPDAVEGAVDDEADVGEVDRLGDEIEGPLLHRLDGGVDAAVRGEDDDVRFRVPLADFLEQVHAGDPRHAQV